MIDLDMISDTYEILEEIGSGGGGKVYKGYHKRLKKNIVIKKIHDDVKDILNSRTEADILKNLRHEYLPQVFDFLEINGNIYTVMDYIPGKSFQELLDEGKTFTQKQIIKWARQLAEALNYLHNQNPPIIHGDIKPANIMLTPNGDICLIDFNISSVFDKDVNQPIGFSDGYSPPEQYPESIRQKKLNELRGKNENIDRKAAKFTVDFAAAKSDISEAEHGAVTFDKMVSSTITDTNLSKAADKSNIYNEELTELLESKATAGTDRTEVLRDNAFINADDKTEIYNHEQDYSLHNTDQYEETDINSSNSVSTANNTRDFAYEAVQKHNYEAIQKVADETAYGAAVKSIGSRKAYIDERSDIYSLGATLYHLICGRKPACSLLGVEPINNQKIKISDGLFHIITKMMKPAANKRFDSAARLLKALNQINRLDKRYKRFLLKWELIVIGMMLLFAASVLSINHGKILIQAEKEELYGDYIEQMKARADLQEYASLEELFNNATELFPTKPDAYYHKILALYQQGLYDEGVKLADTVFKDVISDILNVYERDEYNQMLGDIKYIQGNCYFELEDYVNAAKALKDAVKYNSQNGDYYRDYAISLARISKSVDAANILEQAIKLGIAEDNIHLIKGEIDLANEEYENAVANFTECIRKSKTDYIANRAYVMCSKAYEKAGEAIADSRLSNIRLLEEARVKLPAEMTLIVSERLAEAYVEYGTAADDNSYFEKAIDVFEFIQKMGWDNYQTYNNIAVLYRRIGNYDKAYETLRDMLGQYGDNYNTYKRLAYLEIDIQKEIENENRDYNLFKDYYSKAKELYQKEMKNNKNDVEMDYLDQVYQELIDGNWFD